MPLAGLSTPGSATAMGLSTPGAMGTPGLGTPGNLSSALGTPGSVGNVNIVQAASAATAGSGTTGAAAPSPVSLDPNQFVFKNANEATMTAILERAIMGRKKMFCSVDRLEPLSGMLLKLRAFKEFLKQG